jgi:hypothetical protein
MLEDKDDVPWDLLESLDKFWEKTLAFLKKVSQIMKMDESDFEDINVDDDEFTQNFVADFSSILDYFQIFSKLADSQPQD